MLPNYDKTNDMLPNYDKTNYMLPNYDKTNDMLPNYDKINDMLPNFLIKKKLFIFSLEQNSGISEKKNIAFQISNLI